MEVPDLISEIENVMEALGLRQRYFEPLIGCQART